MSLDITLLESGLGFLFSLILFGFYLLYKGMVFIWCDYEDWRSDENDER